MAVPEILRTIEQTGASKWLRESDSLFGFYFVLLFHTFGLSLLVGANCVVDLRLLGVASNLPLKSMKQLFTIMWVGFALNASTGLLLLYAYPTKALTNIVFYTKLTLIAIAIVTMVKIKRRVFDDPALSESEMMMRGRSLAILSLALWVGAITAGRLLAYTFIWLTYGRLG